MILAAIIFFGLVAIICFALAAEGKECPRVMLGYNCRGKTCDHSPEAYYRAKEATSRNHWRP